ncbi:MAG: tRNA pseudouridine(55) synthase TruB [Betaproteobacteria bacterium]
MNGVLLLDKPTGLSSNAALQRARRCFDAEKAGHTGTLDPLASGLLPLCFGEATKFAQFLLDASKRYTATVRFGAMTTTGDAEGDVVDTNPVALTEADLEAALPAFTGHLQQIPHAYSALKFEGRNLYEYAREGIAVERQPRDIEILELKLLAWISPDAIVDVTCSKGTYIRVLAEDIGRALGCGAHLAGLRRTATGGFGIASAVPLEQLEGMDEASRNASLLPVATLVREMRPLRIADGDAARFRHGGAVPATGLADGPCAAFAGDALLGVADVANGLASPRRVVVATSHPSDGHG